MIYSKTLLLEVFYGVTGVKPSAFIDEEVIVYELRVLAFKIFDDTSLYTVERSFVLLSIPAFPDKIIEPLEMLLIKTK